MLNNLLKKNTPTQNALRSRLTREIGRNAYVDWMMIICVSFIVAIVLVVGSSYLYFIVTQGRIQLAPNTTTESEVIFDRKELSHLIKLFETKEELSAEAKRVYSGISDPSQ